MRYDWGTFELSALESLHTFGLQLDLQTAHREGSVLAGHLQRLPASHPLTRLVFYVENWLIPDMDYNSWSELDHVLGSGRQLQIQFVFDRGKGPDPVTLRDRIRLIFPLSCRRGLISFVWQGDLVRIIWKCESLRN